MKFKSHYTSIAYTIRKAHQTKTQGRSLKALCVSQASAINYFVYMQSTENKTFYEKSAWKAKPFYGRNTTGIIIMFGLTFFKWNHKRRKGQDFHLNRSWPVRLLNIPESIDLLDEQTTKRAINLVLFLYKFGTFLRSAANQQYQWKLPFLF